MKFNNINKINYNKNSINNNKEIMKLNNKYILFIEFIVI